MGVIVNIREHNVDLFSNSRSVTPTTTDEHIILALENAHEELVKMDSSYVVVEQSIEKIYDTELRAYFYSVKTVYKTPQNLFGAFITFYEIWCVMEE